MDANRMIYRVFLQDEVDAHGSIEDVGNCFRIRSGSMNAWTYTNPNWQPNIDEQLRAMGFGSRVGASLERIDGHLIIEHDGTVIGIVHSPEEIPEKSYSLAKEQAERLRDYLERESGKTYVFIDITSRGDKKLAKSLASRINKEYIETNCVSGNSALCVDIGD